MPVNDGDAQLVGESAGDSSWFRTTGLGIVAYMLYGYERILVDAAQRCTKIVVLM